MGPLDHLRVLDLSPTRVGAQASQLLADFGAQVTWVEPPGGAELRSHPAFPFWARGKRSIALDLHDPVDQGVVRSLARSADVLIESFRPGVMERLGLGYDTLQQENPRLVYASITGFGSQGPYADAPGYEGLVLAKLGAFGVFSRMSPHPRPPYVSVAFASFPASQTALHAILAALFERERSGMGQRVETSLAQGFLTLDTWSWFEHLITERWAEAYSRTAMFDDAGRPMGSFPFVLMVALTRDGRWLQFASVAPHLFLALMKALGLDGMFTDPEWAGLPLFGDDTDKRVALWTRMLEAANAMTMAEWEAVFDADRDVFAEPFRIGQRILEHPQLIHDGSVVDLDDPERGTVRQPGPLAKLSATPAELGCPAPLLDEHRAEILAEAGALATADIPRADRPPAASGGLPLAGVTILELAYLFAAPHAATMLDDLGARVIKVEPLEGDPIRTIIAFPESGGAKVMQGKESLCIDLTTPEGLAVIHELAAQADIVLQGFRAGAAAKLGVDFESLRQLNPDLLYVNAPGYGVDGPYGARPAYAPSIGAATGIALTNVGSIVPERSGLTVEEIREGAIRLSAGGATANAQADGFAALGVATAMLLGLVVRQRVGGGQELFTSMLNTGAHANSAQVIEYQGSPGEPAPDATLRGLSALYRIYDASDGWVFLAAPGQRDWERLVVAMAPHADLGADPRLADAAGREASAGALVDALTAIFATRPSAAWEADLLPEGIGCVAVNTAGVEPLLFDESFGGASGYLVDVTHPTFGDHPRLSPFVRFSRSATQAKPGVLAGSHTDAILTELGRDTEQIADLRARTIVR